MCVLNEGFEAVESVLPLLTLRTLSKFLATSAMIKLIRVNVIDLNISLQWDTSVLLLSSQAELSIKKHSPF